MRQSARAKCCFLLQPHANNRSESTPGKAGGFLLWAAQSGLSGVANAAPVELGHLFGGRSFPHVELIYPFVFLFLVADVIPNRSLVAANR